MQREKPLGENAYREGALERLNEAFCLLNAHKLAGAVYLAGRSVEGMLRALIWKHEPEVRSGKKVLETGHDLRRLLTHVGGLGLLRICERDDAFRADVQRVARLWFNNMRFASTRSVESYWRRIGEIGGKRDINRASKEFFTVCSVIIKRCETWWQKQN